jgi:AraC-like DNA-binding protein
MTLYIKNMVCNRCKLAVSAQLEKAGIPYTHLKLGEAELRQEPDSNQLKHLEAGLNELGFELIGDQKGRIIGQIKTQIIEIVHYAGKRENIKLSLQLSERLNHDYSYLSNLFSAVEGTTIEKYYIAQKIERAKELLIYDELNLTGIAYELNYSSVAHLSSQFKQVTGLTPSVFRALSSHIRKPLDLL